MIDPFETQIRVISRYQKLQDEDHYFLLRPQYSIERTKVLKGLLTSPYQKHVIDVMTTITVNASFPVPRRFNLNMDLLKKAIKKAELGLLLIISIGPFFPCDNFGRSSLSASP